MRAIVNFGMYGDQSRIPEWISAEKYEYCENFYQESKSEQFAGFMNVIKRFFAK